MGGRRVGGAEGGVPGERRRLGLHRAADVEQDHRACHRRHRGDQGGAADLRPAAEPEGGCGDGRRGRTGGDHRVRVAGQHGVHRAADRQPGRAVGSDGAVGGPVPYPGGNGRPGSDRADGDPVADVRFEYAKQPVGHLGRADEQQVKVRVGAQRPQSAVNHDGGSIVPAEEVDGDPHGARLHRYADRG
ncbi:hypothetical protein GCM10027605_18250 [Micromonospora zhanjiangensis]